MSKTPDKQIHVVGKTRRKPFVHLEIINGDIFHDDKLIEEEIKSFVTNLQRGASMEIAQDANGMWSPLDYLLRTLRPNITLKKLKPIGLDTLTLLWGAGLDTDQRMNAFKIMTSRMSEHALEKRKDVSKKNFNILIYMRRIFEDDLESILTTDIEK